MTPGVDPAPNNWTLPGGDTPPALSNEGYGAEVRWNVDQLGLKSGHSYRMQIIVHDGDQNGGGGDAGQTCVTVNVPMGLP